MRAGAVAKHCGILTAPDRFIHAYERTGVIEEPLDRRLAPAHRLRLPVPEPELIPWPPSSSPPPAPRSAARSAARPRRLRRDDRRRRRLARRRGDQLLARRLDGADAEDRRPAARHPADHLLDRGRGDPARLRPHADRRQHHLGDRLPRGDRDHPPWRRRQGRRRRRRHRGHRVLLLRLPRGRALRGPDHRHRAHLGRRQADEPRRRDHARPSRRRGPGGRSVHRGEDGRGEHAGLSRHGLCRLRGAAARALRQPAAAALLRGVPADPRRRVRREPGPRRHADPGLGRVRLRDRGRAPRGRRDHVAGERQRRGACRRHRGRARPAAGLRAEGGVGLARRRLVRRRPARRALPHPAGRRGEREDDDAGELVGQRRRPRRGASRQPRRAGPPGLRRHAVRQRRGAGDPGAEGARLPRHLLPVHPDGRAGRQRPAGPVLGQRRRRPASRPIPGAGASPARRPPATPAASTRPPPPARRSPPSSARPSRPTSTSTTSGSSGTAIPTTGACGG